MENQNHGADKDLINLLYSGGITDTRSYSVELENNLICDNDLHRTDSDGGLKKTNSFRRPLF